MARGEVSQVRFMKKPVRQEGLSFKPTDRCCDCGCWLRSGNHTGRCALHAKPAESPPLKPQPPKPETTSH